MGYGCHSGGHEGGRRGRKWGGRKGGRTRGFMHWGTLGKNITGLTLDSIPAGKKVRITNILGGPNFVSRFYSLGLGVNSVIKVISNDVRGLVIDVDGIKYGVGKGFASKIVVEII